MIEVYFQTTGSFHVELIPYSMLAFNEGTREGSVQILDHLVQTFSIGPNSNRF